MNVRRAGLADLSMLLPLVSDYRRFYEQESDAERERAFMVSHLTRATSVVFVAAEQDQAIGFVQMFPTFSTVCLGEVLVLEDLYVAANARRRGAATKLLAAALGYAREIGAVEIVLETANDNADAQALYERTGWTREGRFRKYNASL
jgi:ribosomal protein S18 acetylase RimI-like enzyme